MFIYLGWVVSIQLAGIAGASVESQLSLMEVNGNKSLGILSDKVDALLCDLGSLVNVQRQSALFEN